MASGISQFCANLLLDRILRGAAGSFPATVYVGLYTATPSDTGGGTELTGGQYARQPITVGTTVFPLASAGSTSNSNIIDFGTATANHGSVTQWGMFNAVTTGNLLFWADLTTPQTVSTGNPYSFAIAALVIAMI